MDKLKIKYKNKKWYLVINGIKSETKSIVKSISSYIDALDKPQDLRFILKILIEFKSGQGVFELQTCYATTDFTLPFIKELENQVTTKKIKLVSFTKLSIPNPRDKKNIIIIDNSLINKEYTISLDEEPYTLNKLISYFKESKALRNYQGIYFNSESYRVLVKNENDVNKPMYKGIMYFNKEKSETYIEEFKGLLQMHSKILKDIANSTEE